MDKLSCFAFILLCSCFIFVSSNVAQDPRSGQTKCSLPKRKKVGSPSTQSKSRICSQSEINAATAEATDLFEGYWAWKLSEFPESATYKGIHDYDDRLTDISIEAFKRRYAKVLSFLKEVEKLESCVKDAKVLQSLVVLQQELSSYKEGEVFNGYYLSQDGIRGVERKIPKLLNRMPLKSLADYQKLITRMEKIPNQVNQTIALMKAGMAAGITQHYHSIKNSNGTISKLVSQNPSATSYYKYFLGKFPASLTKQDISQIQERALNLIKNKIVPAFERLRVFITKEYKTRDKVGVSSLPNGQEFYKRLVRIHTSSDFTPQEIHDVGLCEVKRINEEMMKTATKLGYAGMSLREVSKLLKEDPKNYYATKEELLKGYEDTIKAIDLQLPKIFKRVPTTKVTVEADPSPASTLAYYYGPSLDGSKPGTFFVGTNNTKANPKYIFMTLTLHEALPGHHHQISHASEFSGLPLFRRAIIGILGYLASGFSYPTAYTEGWALYAESLGFLMSLFDDPFSEFGHYTLELLRACRLVVDTGMHSKGWTRQQAIDFMENNLALDRKAIERQVDRYIAWPGQALAYKIGQMRILGMREKAEQKLKAAFDVKEFHDIVLNTGSVDLDLVEEEVDKYINAVS